MVDLSYQLLHFNTKLYALLSSRAWWQSGIFISTEFHIWWRYIVYFFRTRLSFIQAEIIKEKRKTDEEQIETAYPFLLPVYIKKIICAFWDILSGSWLFNRMLSCYCQNEVLLLIHLISKLISLPWSSVWDACHLVSFFFPFFFI